MKYMVEEELSNFKFWSQAAKNAELLTTEQLDDIGNALEDFYLDKTPSDTEINDLFWFEFEWVIGLIGLKYNSSTGEIHGDMEEWAEAVVNRKFPDIADSYFSGFWEYHSEPYNPDWEDNDDVIEAFEEYLSDNWLDHANEALNNAFPDICSEARDDFACECWQNCGSDENNLNSFREWYDENRKNYEEIDQ